MYNRENESMEDTSESRRRRQSFDNLMISDQINYQISINTGNKNIIFC